MVIAWAGPALAACATVADPPAAAIARDHAGAIMPHPDAFPEATPLLANGAGTAGTPPGYASFCLRAPDQCETAADPVAVMVLTPQNWEAMGGINRTVNAAIWPEDDEKHYGRAEYWTIPTDGYGDCEDYALTKRKQLMTTGFPAAALRIAVVIAPREGRHAVLTVTTDRGDYVLDNLTDSILPWNQTGFTWIERQDLARPMGWTTLDIQPRRLAAAAP